MSSGLSPADEFDADQVREHVWAALARVEDEDARYHLRESLQLMACFDDHDESSTHG
jgi:hypothetical protein